MSDRFRPRSGSSPRCTALMHLRRRGAGSCEWTAVSSGPSARCHASKGASRKRISWLCSPEKSLRIEPTGRLAGRCRHPRARRPGLSSVSSGELQLAVAVRAPKCIQQSEKLVRIHRLRWIVAWRDRHRVRREVDDLTVDRLESVAVSPPRCQDGEFADLNAAASG